MRGFNGLIENNSNKLECTYFTNEQIFLNTRLLRSKMKLKTTETNKRATNTMMMTKAEND